MSTEQRFETKRLDHLGIVAGICHEIGLMEAIEITYGFSTEHRTGHWNRRALGLRSLAQAEHDLQRSS